MEMPSYLAHKIANGLVAMKRVEPVTGAYGDVYKNIWHFRNTTTGNEWWDFTNENEVLTGVIYKTLKNAVKGMDALLKELTGDETMTTLSPITIYVNIATRKQFRSNKTEDYVKHGVEYSILYIGTKVMHVPKRALAKDYIPLEDLVKVAEIPEPGGIIKPETLVHDPLMSRIGKFYRNNNSNKIYVVKGWDENHSQYIYCVVGSNLSFLVEPHTLDRYYTEVTPPTNWTVGNSKRLAEDDKTETYIREILKRIEGTDTLREGLVETPARVAKAFGHWFKGYQVNVPELFKTFEDGSEGCDQMVVCRRIPFHSHCEHHMAAISGYVDVAYIPRNKIVGLSKMNRVVEAFAQRLQVQERMGNQIADAINDNLDCVGCGVRIVATHGCIESRGVCHQGGDTITLALRGVFRTEAETRAEFLSHCTA